MVQPVTRVLELDHFGIGKVVEPAVAFGVGGPTVGAIQQQCRRADRRPGLVEEFIGDVLDRPDVEMRVEFPAVGAVFVAVDPMHGQVARLLLGEIAVLLDHARECRFYAVVFARTASRGSAFLADPFVEALGIGIGAHFGLPFGAGAQPFDRHDLLDHVGKGPGIAQRDIAAHRVADDGDRSDTQLVDQLGKVVDHVVSRIIAIADPVAVTVASVIERDHMPVLAQLLGHPVPAARMVAPAVHEDQRGLSAIAPVEIVQAQALRDEGLRGRSGM